MSYCTVTDVAAELKGASFSSSTTVTDTQVTSFIAMADAEINSKLSAKYQTPITGTEALVMVKAISLAIVLAKVKPLLKLNSEEKAPNQPTNFISPRAWADRMLKDLMDGSAHLNDATQATSADGVQSFTSNGNGSQFARTFTRDGKAW